MLFQFFARFSQLRFRFSLSNLKFAIRFCHRDAVFRLLTRHHQKSKHVRDACAKNIEKRFSDKKNNMLSCALLHLVQKANTQHTTHSEVISTRTSKMSLFWANYTSDDKQSTTEIKFAHIWYDGACAPWQQNAIWTFRCFPSPPPHEIKLLYLEVLRCRFCN